MKNLRLASFRSVLALALAGLAIVALLGAAGADAKKKKKHKGASVGVWSGDATYTSPPEFGGEGGGIEYGAKFVIRTENVHGAIRIEGVVTTVRTYCPGPGVHDIRLIEGFDHRGPRVGQGGGFSLRVKGVTINGSLGGSRASGRIRASAPGGCELHDGSWEARKQRF
jgi:hypothetical protein